VPSDLEGAFSAIHWRGGIHNLPVDENAVGWREGNLRFGYYLSRDARIRLQGDEILPIKNMDCSGGTLGLAG